jgi:hypothetical protein
MLSLSLWLLLIPSKPFTTPLTTLVLLLSMLIVILSYCTLPALLGTSRSSSLRIPCTLASIILTTDMCNSPPRFSTFFSSLLGVRIVLLTPTTFLFLLFCTVLLYRPGEAVRIPGSLSHDSLFHGLSSVLPNTLKVCPPVLPSCPVEDS